MTTPTRSQFLGVYNNKQESSATEVPFRAAIRRGVGKNATWVNLGYTKTEAVAAKVYNMYAIKFFGKGAIINDLTLTDAEFIEFKTFINDKPKRIDTLAKSRDIANTLIQSGGKFRKHTELAKVTTTDVLLPV